MTIFPHRSCVPGVLNHVAYCAHERDICHVCGQAPEQALAPRFFKLPESGEPEYPAGLAQIPDVELRKLVGKRWLDMQEAILSREPNLFKVGDIKLPATEVPDELRTSVEALQACLLRQFQQLLEMAAEQRYFFANQATIILEGYENFAEAAVLYEKELADSLLCKSRNCARDSGAGRSKASIVTAFGYFLGLETQRTFWRSMEMTAEDFVKYLENYDEDLDGQLMGGKTKRSLLQCLAHAFWSLQHAQYRLDRLRRQQHVDFQHKSDFPVYPYRVREALEAGLDVHLLVTKLSRSPVCDFPLFSSLFAAFRRSSDFTEQMQDVNVDVMAAIDELSTRFRVMEVLILSAILVATELEIKAAIVTFKFDPEAQEVTSTSEDLALSEDRRRPAPFPEQGISLLQTLLVKEALTRRKYIDSFMRAPFLTSEAQGLTVEKFDAFKKEYSHLYHESIRPEFKKLEYSLLRTGAVRRFQHRKKIAKKKKRMVTTQDRIVAHIAQDRCVPKTTHVPADLFWEVGDGNVEKYVPLHIWEKMKTRKKASGTDPGVSDEGSQMSTPKSSTQQSAKTDAVCLPVEDGDVSTLDILWSRVKASVKWSYWCNF